MKVLVIDDSPTMRRIHINCLKGLGPVQVVEASNGLEGLSRLEMEDGVDLVLVDWNMPKMSGLDFIKRVSKHEKFRGTPIIMITSNSDRSSVIEAIKAGARNYLVKPYNHEILRERIQQVLPSQVFEEGSKVEDQNKKG